MATVTIEVPDELSDLVAQAGDRLPELLPIARESPRCPLTSTATRSTSSPAAQTPEQLSAFDPTPEMTDGHSDRRLLTVRLRINSVGVVMPAHLFLDARQGRVIFHPAL